MTIFDLAVGFACYCHVLLEGPGFEWVCCLGVVYEHLVVVGFWVYTAAFTLTYIFIMINQSLDRYVVMGNPIEHSLSPQLHAFFAEQCGETVDYQRVLVPVGGFEDVVRDFQEQGGCGFNVTVPFKEEAFRLVDELDPYAAQVGAVNTVVCRDDGSLAGFNTDGVGLVFDVEQHYGVSLAGKRVLVLGAGGAVRGVLPAVFGCEPELVCVANRTVSKAEGMVAELFGDDCAVEVCSFEGLVGRQFDVVINGTSASLGGQSIDLPRGLIVEGGLAYDMAYGVADNPFLLWASGELGVRAVDGLGMLVAQGAEAFFIWRGVRPDVEGAFRALSAVVST